MTFRGLQLSPQALRSWLLTLFRAGMLGARPAPVSVALPPGNDEDMPSRIEDLNFGFASDMVLDFAQLARNARMKSEQEEAPTESGEATSSPANEPPTSSHASAAVVEQQLATLAAADEPNAESMDEDFLGITATAASEPATIPTPDLAPIPPSVEAPGLHGPELPDIDVVLEAEVAELARHTSCEDDLAEIPEGVSPQPEMAAQVSLADSQPAHTDPGAEARALQSRRLAEMHEMVMARAIEDAMPEEARELASPEAATAEEFVLHDAESVEPAGKDLPEARDLCASQEESGLRAAELHGAPLSAPEQPVVPEVAVELEPIAAMVMELSTTQVSEPADPAGQDCPEGLALPASDEGERQAFAAAQEPDVATPVEPVLPEVALTEEAQAEARLGAELAIDLFVGPPAPETDIPAVEALVPTALEPTGDVEAEKVASQLIEPSEPELDERAEVEVATEAIATSFVEPADQESHTAAEAQAVEAERVAEDFDLETMLLPDLPDPAEQVAPVPVESCLPESIEPHEDLGVAESFAETTAELALAEIPQPADRQAPVGIAVAESVAGAVTREGAEGVMLWEPVELAPQTELTMAEAVMPSPSTPIDRGGNELAAGDSLDPVISSLEDALAMLAVASGVHEAERHRPERHSAERYARRPAAPLRSPPSTRNLSFAEPDKSLASLVATTLGYQRSIHHSLEVAALQGIFIQKDSEMTEMHEVASETDAQGQSVPITSSELQEVAASLSVPKLDADPDDVLSDVQNTLNSLAGMAQGLTQQKQAAGRLQDELEEWNHQLLERERLASDKEERLNQLENHLQEAKTNLDRMAAENNRLLTDRSEALQQLAHSVDQRDKATVKRAEAIQVEQQRIDELAASLRSRASELDERESSIKRKGEELVVRLKQLQSAKDKFSTIVKSFNETVQFNSTLSAISKSVSE